MLKKFDSNNNGVTLMPVGVGVGSLGTHAAATHGQLQWQVGEAIFENLKLSVDENLMTHIKSG